GLRQWRFSKMEEIEADLLKEYLLEAIQNQKDGKMIKVEPKKVEIPAELKDALAKMPELKVKFEALTPGKQKEYSEHIGSAKQEKTRLSRLDKSIPLILEGKGLNDKYR
ncbi:MAG: YdeI/OmpD-associated family protein, partial [Flavobacteriales bacterium]|nr:YdeI/OmpD-associated family protein [Flavobacteriales bacterium]